MSLPASVFGSTWRRQEWRQPICATHPPEDFLAELEDFAEEVSEGKYYDEEAAIYYGEDNYNETDEYDPDDHVGIKALRTFFHEADSYFDAGQFEVARQAYAMLLDLVLGETDETLGVPDPLEIMAQDPRQVVSRYLIALQSSQSQAEFFTQALNFLSVHEHPTDVERFLELVGAENLAALQAHLEDLGRPARPADMGQHLFMD